MWLCASSIDGLGAFNLDAEERPSFVLPRTHLQHSSEAIPRFSILLKYSLLIRALSENSFSTAGYPLPVSTSTRPFSIQEVIGFDLSK